MTRLRASADSGAGPDSASARSGATASHIRSAKSSIGKRASTICQPGVDCAQLKISTAHPVVEGHGLVLEAAVAVDVGTANIRQCPRA